jgi:predicted CoA-binding protein
MASISRVRLCRGRSRKEQAMTTVSDAVSDFLAQRRIAVAGVSRDGGAHSGNAVYKRLRERGYQVFAVNPNTDTVEGDVCYRDLASIPGGVDAVVIATTPAVADAVVADCARLGIRRAWLHRSFGAGSVSEPAVKVGRNAGMTVIAGGCPLMFDRTADFGHKCMRTVLGWMGKGPSVG